MPDLDPTATPVGRLPAEPPPVSFRAELWGHGATTYAEILRHPFLTV